MGAIGSVNRVKLFCAIISADEKITKKAFEELEKKFGKIDITSEVIDFNFTSYYNQEMGNSLKRFWISFEKLVFADELASNKVFTNSIEDIFAINRKRCINIDPGYLNPANVILASTKDFSHRICLSKGIYGEVTLIYKKGDFIKLPWSYPDYTCTAAKNFFLQARAKLMRSLKTLSSF
ncbi:MAG: DUF4416 family protein [Endomicrobium sp.]|jgi:hypothetical protein|nr:DUF4416 family protein [Endomicrobium sp.]